MCEWNDRSRQWNVNEKKTRSNVCCVVAHNMVVACILHTNDTGKTNRRTNTKHTHTHTRPFMFIWRHVNRPNKSLDLRRKFVNGVSKDKADTIATFFSLSPLFLLPFFLCMCRQHLLYKIASVTIVLSEFLIDEKYLSNHPWQISM